MPKLFAELKSVSLLNLEVIINMFEKLISEFYILTDRKQQFEYQMKQY